MFRTRSLMAALLVLALGLSACSGMDVYPTPRPIDLPVGLEEGLIYRDWDGGHPMRLVAFLSNPIGVVFDLFVQERQTVDRSQGGLGLGLTLGPDQKQADHS